MEGRNRRRFGTLGTLLVLVAVLWPAIAAAQSTLGSLRDLSVHWRDRSAGTATAAVHFRAPYGAPQITTTYVVTTGDRSCVPQNTSHAVIGCSIAGLVAGRTYTFTVSATDGVSNTSATVTSYLASEGQVISFPPLPGASFAQGSITVSASATSGLPVSFTASGACVMSGAMVVFDTVGGCAVTASQAGSREFQAAAPVANYFVITPSPVSLELASETITANGAAHALDPVTAPPVTGVVVSYCHASALGPTVCSSHPPADPGVYAVTATLRNPDYTAADAHATLTIVPSAHSVPSAFLGGGTSGSGRTVFERGGVVVTAESSGFGPGDTVAVDNFSEENLGTFTVPSATSPTAWLSLLHLANSSVSVVSVRTVDAHTATQLGEDGTIAFPSGSFPGAGRYELLTLHLQGVLSGTTVAAVLHSRGYVLAEAVAANSGATIDVPLPLAWAGEQHTLDLVAEFTHATTVASASGVATTSTLVPATLLARLASGAPFVTVFDDASTGHVATSTATLPTFAAYGLWIRAKSPLDLHRYRPIAHPRLTMSSVTGAAAVLSATAAGIALARAAGSAAATARIGAIGARGASVVHRGSSENIEALHHTHDRDRVHVGDRSPTWRFPGHRLTDHVSRTLPPLLSRYSPLAAVTFGDGNYWRASFGSLAVGLPVAGAVLGTMATIQTHGYPLPCAFNLFVVITVLGFADALAGLAAAVASLIGGLVTGHAFSLDMLISGLLLATLWFGLPIMVKKLRPFIRPHPRNFDEWWRRLGDFVVGPIFAGFLATKLIDSFTLVSGLDVTLVHHADEIGWIVGSVALARYVLTTSVVFIYPRRLGEVTAARLTDQEQFAQWGSVLVRAAFGAMIFVALLGTTWFVPPLVILLATGMAVRGQELEAKVSDWVYRFVPRNMGKVLVFEVVGTIATIELSHHVASPYWQVALLLFVVISLTMVVDLLSGLKGKEWPANTATRLAGVTLVAVTVAQLSGHLIGS